jgi:hypothetical protein
MLIMPWYFSHAFQDAVQSVGKVEPSIVLGRVEIVRIA